MEQRFPLNIVKCCRRKSRLFHEDPDGISASRLLICKKKISAHSSKHFDSTSLQVSAPLMADHARCPSPDLDRQGRGEVVQRLTTAGQVLDHELQVVAACTAVGRVGQPGQGAVDQRRRLRADVLARRRLTADRHARWRGGQRQRPVTGLHLDRQDGAGTADGDAADRQRYSGEGLQRPGRHLDRRRGYAPDGDLEGARGAVVAVA